MIDDISLEQGTDFFIAYLAKHAGELAIKVPIDRSSYNLVESKRVGRSDPSLVVDIPLENDVTLKAAASFSVPIEPAELDRSAQDLADQLAGFERDRHEMVEELQAFRLHAQKVFKKLPAKSPLKLVSLDLVLDRMSREARHMMTFELLGADAARTVASTEIVEPDDIARELDFRRDDQALLLDRACELEREDGDGAVDAVLVHWSEALGVDLFDIIKCVTDNDSVNFTELLPPGTVLFWKDGILTVGTDLSENIRYHGGFLMIRKCPEHLSGDVSGRKVSEVITHAALPDDLLFASGLATPGKKCDLVVALGYELFSHELGITW